LKDQAFSIFIDQNPPFELPPENGIPPSTKACPPDPSSTTLRRELASRIRGTEFIILSGVGHLSPLEAPSELATAIMKAVSHMR
jgi:hypothetical protein